MTARLPLVLVLLAAACARPHGAALANQPISAQRAWASRGSRGHPLVGRIWDVRAQRFVEEAGLSAALAGATFVLLGEIHDNPDHHAIQARLVRDLTAAGRKPALAFEMMDEDVQPRVEQAIAASPREPDAIARAVDWEHSGWYAFEIYRPIFAAGLDAGLPIVAANLPRNVAKSVAKRGRDALTPALQTELARYEPLAPEVVASLRAEMRASHCDAPLPETFLDNLSLAQRARDAQMASRMREARTPDGAVLVTGNGHARADRGVPSYLAREAADQKVVAVGIFEVSDDKRDAAQYARDLDERSLPYDYVVFTPRTEREDPCEALKGRDWKVPKPAEHAPGDPSATGGAHDAS